MAVGVPLIVIVPPNHVAVTPAGKFVGAPIPVAPVAAWVIGVTAVLTHPVGLELGAEAVLLLIIVIVPVPVAPQGNVPTK